MSDLIDRLRMRGKDATRLEREAIEEIERLRAEIARWKDSERELLRGALERIAKGNDPHSSMRIAREALKE